MELKEKAVGSRNKVNGLVRLKSGWLGNRRCPGAVRRPVKLLVRRIRGKGSYTTAKMPRELYPYIVKARYTKTICVCRRSIDAFRSKEWKSGDYTSTQPTTWRRTLHTAYKGVYR